MWRLGLAGLCLMKIRGSETQLQKLENQLKKLTGNEKENHTMDVAEIKFGDACFEKVLW